MSGQPSSRSGRPAGSRWAPWWAYVIPILALNYLRQLLIPPADVGDAVSVALFAVIVIVVVAVVTIVQRRRSRAPGRKGETV